jgi:TP901 family phage tail tape measure protein
MATRRKEYEMLFKLTAAFGGNFQSTFNAATKNVTALQKTMQTLSTTVGKVESFTKQSQALETNKVKFAELQTKSATLQKELDELKEKENALNKQLEDGIISQEKHAAAMDKNNSAIERKNSAIDKNDKAIANNIEKITAQERKLDELSGELKDAGVNTDNLAEENEKLTKTFEDLAKAESNYSKATSDLDENNKKLSATRTELLKTTGLIAGAGAAMWAGAVQPAIEYESAFAGVKKTVNGTPEQLAALSEQFKQMSTTIPVNAVELAQLGEAAGQLGIKTENIADFTRVMADLGVATNLGGSEGASTLAQFANVAKMSQNEFGNLGSSIVALGNNFATTEADIAAMAMRIVGAGKQVGMSESDILGLSAALSSVGIEAEMGGSAISKVLTNMAAATIDSGGKLEELYKVAGLNPFTATAEDLQYWVDTTKSSMLTLADNTGMTKSEINTLISNASNLESFSKVAGMTSEQFKKAFADDAVGALQSFIGGLGNAEKSGDSAIAMLQEMGINEVRLRDSLLRAAGAGDLLTDAVNLSNEAWIENNALSKEAAQRYQTTESKIQIAKNTFAQLQMTIGDMLLPKITEFMGKLQEIIPMVSAWVTENKETIATVAKVAAGLLVGKVAFLGIKTVVLSVTGVYKTIKVAMAAYQVAQAAMAAGTTAFGAISSAATAAEAARGATIFGTSLAIVKNTAVMIASKAAMVAAAVATKVVTAAQWLFNAAMSANPIGIVIMAVAALVAGIILLVKNWDKVKEVAMKVGEGIKQIWGNISDWFKKIWGNIVGFFSEAWEKIKAPFIAAAQWFNNTVIQPIIRIFAPIVEKIGEIFSTLWQIAVAIFSFAAQ